MSARPTLDWSYLVTPDDAPAKQAIVKAALRLFVSQGLAETSIREIAAAAGYTNPALFKHFENRDALAFHLFERSLRHFGHELSAARRPDQTFNENLRAMLAVYLRAMDQSLDAFLFVQENLRTFWPRLSPAVRALSPLRQLRTLLEQGVVEGRVNPARPSRGASRSDPENLLLLVAAVSGFLTQFSRMLYFDEFTGDALARLDEVERVVRATVA